MIEINEEFKQALELLENTDKNIFINGKAGTGKSTLLKHFRSITHKNIAALAPTGVAVVNIQGETIRSFLRFRPDIALSKIKSLNRGENRVFRADRILEMKIK
ncbi:MAG: AAA family ATPase [Elusimicrobia bacterium]|nr:AAA family ATPase [Elusimicrobiota bacterium]